MTKVTITTTAQAAATNEAAGGMSPRAASALLAVITDPKACDKQRRRDLDSLFPVAKEAEARLKWAAVAASVKELHRALLNETKVGDDQGVVGEAYRWTRRASHRDSGATAQMVAHTAIEKMAKSFVTDGTYANYAMNPDGIRHISGLVGDLQDKARGLMRAYAAPLGGLVIEDVFFTKTVAEERAEWEAEGAIFGREAITAAWEASGVRARWEAAAAERARLRKVLTDRADQGEDLDPADDEALSKASIDFVKLPAPDLNAVMMKAEAELLDHTGSATIEDALSKLEADDTHGAWKASVYRDLARLTGSTVRQGQAPQFLAAE